jgi:hypothetical protein
MGIPFDDARTEYPHPKVLHVEHAHAVLTVAITTGMSVPGGTSNHA